MEDSGVLGEGDMQDWRANGYKKPSQI